MRNMNMITTTQKNCDQDIDYDEYIDKEELDGILEYTKINPSFHQDKDKDNYEDVEE